MSDTADNQEENTKWQDKEKTERTTNKWKSFGR